MVQKNDINSKKIYEGAKTLGIPAWILTLRNILISAVAGILSGCVLFPWFGAILQATQRDNYALFNLKSLFLNTLTSPVLILYIIPILLPLIGTACLAGLIFQKSIEKHLGVWCILSPISVWLAVIAMLVRKPANAYDEQFSWFERFLIEIPSPDHFLFLIAPAFSAFIFYKLSNKGL